MREPEDVLLDHVLALAVSALVALGMLAFAVAVSYAAWRLGIWALS